MLAMSVMKSARFRYGTTSLFQPLCGVAYSELNGVAINGTN